MLYSQSGLDQILTVEMPVLCCVSDAYPVSGLDSLVLASERNRMSVIMSPRRGLDSLVLASERNVYYTLVNESAGLDSLDLASERNFKLYMTSCYRGLDSLVLAIVKSAFVSGTPDTP